MPPLSRAATAALHVTLSGLERARRSKTRGRIRLGGLAGPVEVLRDRWGVPHIYAADLPDLLFAQGFAHGQDRLWQMDFQRRVVRGRLAEVFGPAVLETDRAMRILGMYRVAEAEADQLDPECGADMEAYAAGVNAAIASQPLPVEFTLLRYRPERWTPADSLCWAKMMAWGLSINWETELLRAQIIARLGPELAAELEQGGVASPIVTTTEVLFQPAPKRGRDRAPVGVGAISAEVPSSERDLPSTGGSLGSNNWVIGGARTATGKPLLANDMHLPITSPAIWYENHLALTDGDERLDVTGVSFPGLPYVVSGHNGRVAWGFTNGFADVQDLYVERLRRSTRGVEWEYKGEWRTAEARHEEIKVKGGPAIDQEVVVTGHGPVINQLARGLAAAPGPDGLPSEPLALRWTALEPLPMIDALRRINRAQDCEEFREALRGWIAPVQNVVYADINGNIGYTYAGRIPVRAQGHGKMPVPGWTGEWEWTGYIPFEELPHQRNPRRSYIATANNRVVDSSYPHFLSAEFSVGDRAERIIELIERSSKVTVTAIRQMHLDQRSPSLVRLAEQLGRLQVDDPELQGLVTLVNKWDRELSAESPAATVCEIFGRIMQRVILEVRLGNEPDDGQGGPSLLDRAMGRGPTPGIQESSFFYHRLWEWLYQLLDEPDSHWFDLGHGEKREDVMRLALRRTLNYLSERLGEAQPPDYLNWAWRRLHLVTFGHVAGRVAALAGHFSRGPYPVGGNGHTIFATGGGITPEASTAVVAPPFRFIADLSDLSKCYGLLAPGNSGRPDSPHYDDQVGAWFTGQYHPMLYRRADVERGARRKLKLLPVAGRGD